jgi:hypothetical protein
MFSQPYQFFVDFESKHVLDVLDFSSTNYMFLTISFDEMFFVNGNQNYCF